MIDFEKLFLASAAAGGNAVVLNPITPVPDPFRLYRAEEVPGVPIEFKHLQGDKWGDMVGTGWPPLTLVSRRFVDVLRFRGFSGWTTYPVNLGRVKQAPIDIEYGGLAITGRCGPFLESLSTPIIQAPVAPGGDEMPAFRGLFFEPTSWDGCDLFVAENYGRAICVEAVKRALEESGLTNLRFVRLTEFERMWKF